MSLSRFSAPSLLTEVKIINVYYITGCRYYMPYQFLCKILFLSATTINHSKHLSHMKDYPTRRQAVYSFWNVICRNQLLHRCRCAISIVFQFFWSDDSHYLIRNFDAEKNLVTFSVDIKNRKSKIVPTTKTTELLTDLFLRRFKQ